MTIPLRRAAVCGVGCISLWGWAGAISTQSPAQVRDSDAAAVIRRIDGAVQYRYQHILGFTDVEHYAVFRGKDQSHPIAEMMVKDTYRKGTGKTYTILSRSGSVIAQKFGLKPLLDNETSINEPAKVAQSWFTSANYEMKLQSGEAQRLNGIECFAIAVSAKRKAPNMIDGTIWVNAKDGSLVQIEGFASKSPSVFAKTTHMMRQYAQVDGFSMATHARAESNSPVFGRTVVTIDYSDYHLQVSRAN